MVPEREERRYQGHFCLPGGLMCTCNTTSGEIYRDENKNKEQELLPLLLHSLLPYTLTCLPSRYTRRGQRCMASKRFHFVLEYSSLFGGPCCASVNLSRLSIRTCVRTPPSDKSVIKREVCIHHIRNPVPNMPPLLHREMAFSPSILLTPPHTLPTIYFRILRKDVRLASNPPSINF